MSEQWTVEWLDEMLDLKFERGPVSMRVAEYIERLEKVSNAHNTAIAVEREGYEKVVKDLAYHVECLKEETGEKHRLRQQLAAEREVSLGLIKNLHDCEQQLAAEREKCKALVEAIESYLVKQRVQILKEALVKGGK
jgi:hypothetical protein